MPREPNEPTSLTAVVKFLFIAVLSLTLVGLLGIVVYSQRFVDPGQAVADIGPPDTAAPGGRLILPLANYAFVPDDVTVPVGTTIVFQNVDDDLHTVTFDDNAYPALGLEQRGTQEILFDREGVYRLYCEFHGSPGLRGMSATIRVVPASASIGLPTSAAIPSPTPRPTIPPLSPSTFNPNGFGLFQDTLGRSDSFSLTVSHLPSAPVGDYYVWLTGDGPALNLGSLTPDASGNANLLYFSPGDVNLLATYTGFLITLESAGSAPDQPSSSVVFGGVMTPGILGPARQLLVAGEEAPGQTAYAIGLVEQAEELLLHAREIDSAAQAGDVASMDRHIEHLSAIVAGQGSPDYRDFQGDGFVSDPGDGFGILNYARAVIRQAQAAALAPGANEDQKMRAAQLEQAANTVQDLSNQLIVLRSAAHDSQAASERTVFTGKIFELSIRLLNGQDANGNGAIEPDSGEGGVYTAYFQSQYLASMGALAMEVLPAGTEPALPTATVVKPPPATATLTGDPSNAPTPTPGAAIVTMRNFEFVPEVLKVRAGTTVVFVIRDSQHHLIHSFPDSNEVAGFDSGLLDAGEQFAFTFNEPGTYTLRCREHLKSMVMTLVVEP